ncbi:hypothetical protein HanRHA438_Chr02g0081251 [Helianthus annuus]|nr:hypothetical protein HanRHA438_Chr02g0081251 [Helianthus annuus]
MTMALRYFIELGEKHVLAQVWAPVKNKGRFVLTTSGQPFVLDPNCTGLRQYRMASLMYSVSVDDGPDGVLELVGRVFKHKLPECATSFVCWMIVCLGLLCYTPL